MKKVFTNAKVLTPLVEIENGMVVVGEDGKIEAVGAKGGAIPAGAEVIDAGGRMIIPGLIDIHHHGGNGVLFELGADHETMTRLTRWVASTGVTGFLRSIAAPTAEAFIQLIADHVREIESGSEGAAVLGLHLEGPSLCLEKKGAFNPSWIRNPDPDEARRSLAAGKGWIRQVTIAPELPHADEVAAIYRKAGVTVALGHSNTNYEIASRALAGNFNHVTHTFNAQSNFSHRAPGVMGAVLASDNVTAELISDTIHVHPGAMKALIHGLGPERVAIITDAAGAAGMADGEYEMVGQHVIVKNGSVRLPDGTLAGSMATMNACVRNVNQVVGIPLLDAVRMASLTPAKAIGLAGSKGSLEVGKDADLAIVDGDLNVYLTLVAGKIVYNRL
ncbi:MAG TPA: N-acetylglucosamine-6-phosphate deacetylase [Anaerolineaceae bacterium]|nr:N-acetylglucosamine-6-phosphate deacetylase [Anaerolineaceae bacterium]